ncbi:hypothetical protein [Proteiniphilum sp. UBA5384]|uniref:hypothetical protein n=1 Tax=Proteiniphilum sp. UBA5384 TaxID=1947279 RepID=UPI0025E209E5|nr:hypothetical protein [Proteiniphilum sp. UBA5384]
MKRILIRSAAIFIFAAFCSVSAYTQQVRVALKGDAYLLKKGEYIALEVGGKIVIGFDEEFTGITSSDGKYFIADYDGEEFYIYDRAGKEVELGGGLTQRYDKIAVIDGTIVVTKKGETRYYSGDDPSVEIKAQTASHDFFDKGREFNPEKMAQAVASEQAKYLSGLVRPDGKFEIRPKPNSNRQQIFVNGKMLHEAQEYKVVSDSEWWSKTGCWAIIAKNSGKYGAVLLEVYEEDGKKGESVLQVIPYQYSFVSHHGGNMLKCTTISGAPHYFNFSGWKFDFNWKEFIPTYVKWVHNKSSNEWTLQKQEEKK